MPYVGKGTYKGAKYKVEILGWRRFATIHTLTLPYWVGTKIHFKLRVNPTEETKLNNLPLYVRYSEPEHIAELKKPKELPDHECETVQGGMTASGERTIEYWIGNPQKIDSRLIFSARGIHNDTLIMLILGVLLGVILSTIAAYILP